jgi:hypothetical protein
VPAAVSQSLNHLGCVILLHALKEACLDPICRLGLPGKQEYNSVLSFVPPLPALF